jgi:hypothetical protein
VFDQEALCPRAGLDRAELMLDQVGLHRGAAALSSGKYAKPCLPKRPSRQSSTMRGITLRSVRRRKLEESRAYPKDQSKF